MIRAIRVVELDRSFHRPSQGMVLTVFQLHLCLGHVVSTASAYPLETSANTAEGVFGSDGKLRSGQCVDGVVRRRSVGGWGSNQRLVWGKMWVEVEGCHGFIRSSGTRSSPELQAGW